MLLFSSHMEANFSHNGDKNVTNNIMGSYAFITMGVT